MSGQPYERDLNAPLTDLSVSRIKVVDQCGLAFKYHYVDHIPAGAESAAMLFGNVVHDGVEKWYGTDAHSTTPLGPIFTRLWSEYLPSHIWTAVERLLAADRDSEALAQAIKIARPDLKSPRTTKAFLESAEHKRFEDLRENMLQKCEKVEELRWPKDENPLVAYRKSLVIAEQMEARWGKLPKPLVVEEPFLLEFEGYNLKGRIDQIRQDPDEHGQPQAPLLVDIKSGRQPLIQMEAFVQAFIYDEACRTNPNLPDVDGVVFWLARHDKGQKGKIDPERHRKIALQILNNIARRIITGAWEPSYGMWCKRCDYAELCERQIGLWEPGTDGFALEVT